MCRRYLLLFDCEWEMGLLAHAECRHGKILLLRRIFLFRCYKSTPFESDQTELQNETWFEFPYSRQWKVIKVCDGSKLSNDFFFSREYFQVQLPGCTGKKARHKLYVWQLASIYTFNTFHFHLGLWVWRDGGWWYMNGARMRMHIGCVERWKLFAGQKLLLFI